MRVGSRPHYSHIPIRKESRLNKRYDVTAIGNADTAAATTVVADVIGLDEARVLALL